MPPKEPIRIGLTKNKTKDDAARGGENVDLPQSPDLDQTMPPLSASVMNVLEDMVDDNESEDLFADEIERDIDPDYIQPENEPRPSTSKSVHKQPLKLVTVSVTDGKGRSTAPIWRFFDVSDKKVNGRLEKGAVCKVDVGGVPCGKRILQNGSSTTGLNQHLERRHPAAFEECKTNQINIQAEKMATKRTLNDRFDDLEGKKRYFSRFKSNNEDLYNTIRYFSRLLPCDINIDEVIRDFYRILPCSGIDLYRVYNLNNSHFYF